MAYEIILNKPYINTHSYNGTKYCFGIVETSTIRETAKAIKFSFKGTISILYMEEQYIEKYQEDHAFWIPKSVLMETENGYEIPRWFLQEKDNLGSFIFNSNYKDIIKGLLFDCIDEVQRSKGEWGGSIYNRFKELTYNQVINELEYILSYK